MADFRYVHRSVFLLQNNELIKYLQRLKSRGYYTCHPYTRVQPSLTLIRELKNRSKREIHHDKAL